MRRSPGRPDAFFPWEVVAILVLYAAGLASLIGFWHC